jgi:hypothetical protein
LLNEKINEIISNQEEKKSIKEIKKKLQMIIHQQEESV